MKWLKRLADECHEHGAAVMIQLTHLGRRTNWNKADWLPVLAPSPVREPAHRSFPKEMEDWDIERIVGDFAAAAQRMKEAGLDGIEFECYGHLLDQFWSPATNTRSDDFGGSLDNRLRFSLRVLAAVRKAVGPEFIVGCRLVADEDWDQGLSKEEGLEICRRLIATGHVDFLNLIRGHIEHDAPLSRVIPVTGMASAPHLDFAGEVRQATKFPVFHAARINDVATARHAIAEGKLDMVGMTRAHLADPHIVSKIIAGRESDIRPCVGATYCLDRIYEGNDALCIHNPATGREASMPHVIAPARGREEARGGRRRGSGRSRGGARVAPSAATRSRCSKRRAKPAARSASPSRSNAAARSSASSTGGWPSCEKLRVDIRFHTYAEAADVDGRSSPTSSSSRPAACLRSRRSKRARELATTAWDILSGDAKPAEDVLLFDDNGAHPGLAAAELIAATASRLEIVSPERYFAPEMGGLNLVPYMKIFEARRVRITTMTRVRALKRQGNRILAILHSPYAEKDVG